MNELSKLKLSSKKAIIFDLDGTLIDSIGVWNSTDKELIYHLSGKEVSENQIQSERDDFLVKNQNTDIYLNYCSYLKEKYNIKPEPSEILDLRWNISNKTLQQAIDYKENADAVLNGLKKSGFLLALATVTTKIQLDIYSKNNLNIMKKAPIPKTFDLIISKEDVIYKKPNPEIYLKVLERLNLQPNQALIFEDSLVGVQAAKNAGIEVVNVYDKHSDVDRCKIDLLSDYKIRNYAEILEIIPKYNSDTPKRSR